MKNHLKSLGILVVVLALFGVVIALAEATEGLIFLWLLLALIVALIYTFIYGLVSGKIDDW